MSLVIVLAVEWAEFASGPNNDGIDFGFDWAVQHEEIVTLAIAKSAGLFATDIRVEIVEGLGRRLRNGARSVERRAQDSRASNANAFRIKIVILVPSTLQTLFTPAENVHNMSSAILGGVDRALISQLKANRLPVPRGLSYAKVTTQGNVA